MDQEKLERCSNGCCHFIGGKEVTKAKYEEAMRGQPGDYPAITPGHRNAIVETLIACRRQGKKE